MQQQRGVKRSMRVGVASLLVMLVASRARAEARPPQNQEAQEQPQRAYVLFAIQGRNGDYLAFEPVALFLLGAPGKSHRPIAALVRGELGVGGAGGGVGLAIDWWPSANPYPNPEEIIYGGLMTVEARAERMYGPTSWTHTTYVGPQGSFNLMFKFSVGWMINVRDSRDDHLQFGLGAGF